MKKKLTEIINFLKIANNLKTTERWLSISCIERHESSADHSWKMSMMVMILTSEFDFGIDGNKVLKMAIVHDLVEAVTGDIDHSLVAGGIVSMKQKVENEKKAITKLRKSLPRRSGKEIYDLWHEFEEARTPEARFCKAADRLETMHHYLSYNLKGNKRKFNPDLQAVYCDKSLTEFPQLLPMLKILKQMLKKKYKEAGISWLPEYEVV